MVGIVILNYNNALQTAGCLNSLYKHCRDVSYKLVVVDNASENEDLETLKRECSETILFAEENRGYACGNNIGLRYFEKDPDVDAILILNNDTFFTEDILTPLYSYLMSHNDCGVVFPLVMAPDGSVDRACARRQKTKWELVLQASSLGKLGIKSGEFLPVEGLTRHEKVETEVPPGSCMMLRKSVFREIGYFDEGTFLYFEEHIIRKKLDDRHLKSILLPRHSILHLGALTTGKQSSKTVYKRWRQSYLHYLKNYSGICTPVQQLLRFRTYLKTLL